MIEFPLSRQYFVHSSDSYVITSIIMSQHNFSAASASWFHDPSFYVAIASLFRLCYNTYLYYLHFCRNPKSLLQQRLVATELDFLLQPSSDVATWLLGVCQIFAVVTQFSCRDTTLLCSA